jgi:hypothetical protein
MLISRRADSPDRILVVDDSGGTRVLNSTDKVPFPVSILGWHEIEAVADKASTRIALLDHIEDEGRGVSGLYKDISTHVERARDQLLLLQRHTKKLDGMLKDLWELRRKRSTLQRLEQGDLLTLQQQYEWYLLTEQQLIALKNNSSQRSVAVPEGVISSLSLELKEAPTPDVVGPAADSLAGVMETLCENAATETRSITELQGVIGKVLVAADQAINYLAVSFSGFRESVYTPKVNALPPEDREILTKQILVLEETKRLPLVEKECEELLKTVTSTSRELSDICDAICKTREQIVAGREQLVSSINREMGSVIQLRFLRSANKESRSLFQNRYGNDGVILVGYVQRFGKPESYENLKALFDKLTLLSLDQGQWDITDTLWDIRLLELLDVFDEDDVEIALAVGKAGFVPMKNLSAGQRCVAVFPLLLRNTRGPLVIDQPEDNLDNRYIADVIAPDLLHRKQRQQFIVTSHNANLVVLTDADLVIHFDSDGTTSFIPAAGFLSCATSTIRQSVLDVLDGGEAALAARQRKYGIRN